MDERITEKDWHEAKFRDAVRSLNANYEKTKLKKLWELENGLEEGLIKRFPCKVGDTVYSIWSGLGQEQTVKVDTVWHFTVRDKVYITTNYIEEGELGVDVFLTEKEAKKKLAELIGEEE